MRGLRLGALALLTALGTTGVTGCSSGSGSGPGPAAEPAAAHVTPSATGARSGVSVTAAEIRVPATPDVTAGYLTIVNAGPADTLTGVSTPAAAAVEMHRMVMSGNTMAMEAMKSVPVPAGGTVRFAQGGMHLMLMRPKALKAGRQAELTLHFTNAGDVTAPAKIVPVTTELR